MFRFKKILKAIVMTFILFLALLYVFFIGFEGNKRGAELNKGNNAIWISNEWARGKKSSGEIDGLVKRLLEHDIKTVFVHTGPIKADGSIDKELYENSKRFLTEARGVDSTIKYQAWLGQIRGKIPLERDGVRQNIALECLKLTKDIGYDGIHFDIEPVWDGDLEFIETLKECREVVGEEVKISVALAEFIPRAFIFISKEFLKLKNYNSEINYKNVAKYADQIVTMVYDTSIKDKRLYTWLVKEQTIWLSRLLKNKELFIAIPAYEDVREGFDKDVENIFTGTVGVIEGLNNSRANYGNFAGIAIYPEWQMSNEEWQTFKELWIK